MYDLDISLCQIISGGHIHVGEHPAGGANQAKEKEKKTATAYEMEEAKMLEEKTVRSSMEQW